MILTFRRSLSLCFPVIRSTWISPRIIRSRLLFSPTLQTSSRRSEFLWPAGMEVKHLANC